MPRVITRIPAQRSTPASSTISPCVVTMPADLAMPPDNATPAVFPPTALLPLVRLLQIASPTLPIGAYSYSQGLEWAVESRDVRDAASAHVWIGDVLECVVAPGEAAMAWRLVRSERTRSRGSKEPTNSLQSNCRVTGEATEASRASDIE